MTPRSPALVERAEGAVPARRAGLEYERRTVPFEEPRPDWHLRRQPARRHSDADRRRSSCWPESNAILRYLAAREGRDDLLPAVARERARVDWRARRRGDDAAPGLPRGRRARLRLPLAAAASARSRRSPTRCRPRSRASQPTLSGVLAAARGRRLRLSGPADAGRLRCDAVALATAPRGRARRPRPAAGLGRDRRRAPRLGTGRRRERDPGVITSRANSHVKAARALGEAKERKRTGLFVDEGEDALRAALAAGIAPVEAFVDDDLGSDRIADELAAAGTTRAALHDGGDERALVALAREPRRRRAARERPPAAGRGIAGERRRPAALRRVRPRQPRHAAAQRPGLRPRARCAGRGLRRSALAARGASEHGRALHRAGDHAAARRRCCPSSRWTPAASERWPSSPPHAPVAFALGGERTGLPPEVTASNAVARIPLADGAESLNVAIAGALALYELRRFADVDLVALTAVQGLAVEARLGRDHGQARPRRRARSIRRRCAIRASSGRRARAGGRRVRGGARLRPRAGRSLMPSRRAIQRSCVARMSAALGSKTSNTKRPSSPSRAAAALRACTRSASPERCMNVRKGAITRSRLRQRRRVAQVADDGLDELADAQALRHAARAWASIAGEASSAITR